MKKKEKTAFYLRWNYWLILALIIIVGVFSWSEKEIEQKQPSAEWSMGIRLLEDLPTDERKVSFTESPDGRGFAIGYVNRSGVHLQTFDPKGEPIKSASFEHNDLEAIRLLKLEVMDGKYRLYLSDRIELEAWDLIPDSLEKVESKVLSSHSEQFDTEGNIVFVGDDEKIEIYQNDLLIGEYTGYEDLKLGVITSDGDGIYGGFNAADGGRVFRVTDGSLEVIDLVHVAEQKVYGYFKDIYVKDDLITLMSINFDRTNPGAASPLGIWQFDKSSMETLYFQPYYHVGTDLNPIIVDADLKKVTYVLGTLQTTRTNNSVLMKYPQAGGGTFANVSKYTRDDDVMIENTRLTVTRKYPVGYSYMALDNQPILLWLDKEGNSTTLMASGQGTKWIELARSKFEVNYLSLVVGSMVSLLNTTFLGIISLLTMVSRYNYLIIGFIILLALYKRFAPVEQTKKEKQVFWISVVAFAAFKLWVLGIDNIEFKMYAYIYPYIFGNDYALILISIFTTLYSLWMLRLFKRQHPYYVNRFLHFMLYFAFELFFIMFTALSFLVSALLKSNFMM